MQRWTRLCVFCKAMMAMNHRPSDYQSDALTELIAIHCNERVQMVHTLLGHRIHFVACLSPAGYSTVLQDSVRPLQGTHHPWNCVVAIEGIYDNNATLSHTGSHVGLGWTAAPPAAVHRSEFPSSSRSQARRPTLFPSHMLRPYCQRSDRRQTPRGAGEACMN